MVAAHHSWVLGQGRALGTARAGVSLVHLRALMYRPGIQQELRGCLWTWPCRGLPKNWDLEPQAPAFEDWRPELLPGAR